MTDLTSSYHCSKRDFCTWVFKVDQLDSENANLFLLLFLINFDWIKIFPDQFLNTYHDKEFLVTISICRMTCQQQQLLELSLIKHTRTVTWLYSKIPEAIYIKMKAIKQVNMVVMICIKLETKDPHKLIIIKIIFKYMK